MAERVPQFERASGIHFAGTKQAEAAQRFIEFVLTPTAARVMKARGLEPLARDRDP